MLLEKSANDKFFTRYFIWLYIIFIIGFFVLPKRFHRNYFYLFLIIPFFITIDFSELKKLAFGKVCLFSFFYCIFILITLGWADGLFFKDYYNFVRKGFLVIIFIIMTAVFFHKNWLSIDIFFKYTCLFSGFFLFLNIALYFFNDELRSRIIGIGTLNNPIIAASGYAVVGLIAYFNFLLQKGVGLRDKLPYFLVMIGTVVFIVLSQSRGPLLAFVGTVIFGTICFKPKYIHWVLSGFILPAVAVYVVGWVDFFSLIYRADSYRLTIWEQSWHLFLDQPWFGYGMSGTRPEIFITKSILAPHSHNLFLSTMLDGGVVALGLLLALLIWAFSWALRCFRKTGNITLFALMIFAVLSNITDGKPPIASPNYQWLYFWLPIGLVAAYELRYRLGE